MLSGSQPRGIDPHRHPCRRLALRLLEHDPLLVLLRSPLVRAAALGPHRHGLRPWNPAGLGRERERLARQLERTRPASCPVQRGDRASGVDTAVLDAGDGNRGREDGFAHLVQRGVRMRGPEQRRHSGDVRTGHARPVVALVLARRGGGEDSDARRSHQRAAIGKRRQKVVRRRRSHRENVVELEAGGIPGLRRGVIARRRHEKDALLAGALDRLRKHLARAASAPRCVDDAGAVIGGESDGAREVVAAATLRPDGSQRHQRDLPVHAGDADAVVAARADGAGHVRAVPSLRP